MTRLITAALLIASLLAYIFPLSAYADKHIPAWMEQDADFQAAGDATYSSAPNPSQQAQNDPEACREQICKKAVQNFVGVINVRQIPTEDGAESRVFYECMRAERVQLLCQGEQVASLEKEPDYYIWDDPVFPQDIADIFSGEIDTAIQNSTIYTNISEDIVKPYTETPAVITEIPSVVATPQVVPQTEPSGEIGEAFTWDIDKRGENAREAADIVAWQSRKDLVEAESFLDQVSASLTYHFGVPLARVAGFFEPEVTEYRDELETTRDVAFTAAAILPCGAGAAACVEAAVGLNPTTIKNIPSVVLKTPQNIASVFRKNTDDVGIVGNKLSGAPVTKEGTTVIGRVQDLKNLKPGEKSLLNRLPDKGNPKANWKQNSGVLRQEMGKGKPIRDASSGDTSGQFLNAERNLLRDRGWTFDSKTNDWMPPK